MKNLGIDLSRDEEIIGLVRKSLASQWLAILLGTLWVLVPFFFFFPLLAFGGFGLVFFAVFEISGLLYGLKRWRMWRNTMLMITDKRVIDIDQVGFFKRDVSEVSYADIKDINAHNGTLKIRTSKNAGFHVEIKGIRHPQRVADLILEVQYLAQSHDTHASYPSSR